VIERKLLAFRDASESSVTGMRTAVRLDTSQPVLVAVASGSAADSVARSRLRNELSLLRIVPDDETARGGVLRPLELVEDDEGLLLVFDDPGALPLSLADPHPDVGRFLPLALQLARTLEACHRHGVVHCGLEPDEILVGDDGTVWLAGFGDGAVLGGDSLPPVTLDDPDVRLPYISPEQTGRMNRSIDHRTDLYSLGVVLYEFLTGTLPFDAVDTMGWVHAHIAQRPQPVRAWRGDVPVALSRILDRLLSKNAGDRYQSAAGLVADLEHCVSEWELSGGIEDFALAQADPALRFAIPDRLYGREEELRTLYERFEGALDGGRGFVAVTGLSGIGKSRLIQELHRPVVTHHAWFVSGKSDQYRRGQPYLAIIRALGQLIEQVLTEPDARVAEWRELLLAAVGPNGQVIVDVLPEIELLIGPQEPVPDLRGTEALQRFTRTFLRLIQAIEGGGRTLVLFLDDLQWADTPSLSLLESLLASPDTKNLLVIGAYRDNEVGEDHPLRASLRAMEQAGVPVGDIALGPLQARTVAELVADTLGARPADVRDLAAAVFDKTGGNPFFVSQFLRRLYHDRVISIDPLTGTWTWDDDALAHTGYTDNVVELVAGRLVQLDDGARKALLFGALLGNRFELSKLAELIAEDAATVGSWLRQAVDLGLILAQGDALRVLQSGDKGRAAWFRFLHDRVQEAAYGQVADADLPALHLRVGQALLADTPPAELGDTLFDVVAHLGQGIDLVDDPATRLHYAELHRIVGTRAMGAVAHDLARDTFERGLRLTGTTGWDDAYDLQLALVVGAADACYLTGEADRAQAHADAVLAHARDLLDRIRVHEMRIHFLSNALRFGDALAEGRQALELLGYPLDDPADPARFPEMVGAIFAALGDRPVPSLIDMDEIDDARAEAAIRISTNLVPTVAVSRPDLLPPMIFVAVRVYLEHGQTPSAATACSVYGLLLAVQGQYALAGQFGDLAMAIQRRYPDSWLCDPIYAQLPAFVHHWTRPIRDLMPYAREGITRCPELGDIVNAGYAANGWMIAAYLAGTDLAFVQREFATLYQTVQATGQFVAGLALAPWGQAVACLRGDAPDPAVLSGDICDPAQLVPTLEQVNFVTGSFYYWSAAASLSLWFGRPADAVEQARKALGMEMAVLGASCLPWNRYLLVLALIQQAGRTEGDERAALLAEADALVESADAPHMAFAHLTEQCPANFRHRELLVQAERARVDGRELDAMRAYDAATDAARLAGVTGDAALGLELAARFHRDAGRPRVAAVYVADARDACEEWGALAKVAQLEADFPELLRPRAAATPAAGATSSTSLDLATVTKASQAIAGELLIDRLLQRLMRILLESAGARRALLLLPRDNGLRITAVGTVDDDQVDVLDQPIGGSVGLAGSVVNYVARTQDTVVIGDARTTQRFAADGWLHDSGVRSLLCAPLVNQGELSAIVYLENDLATDAFTPDRIELLRVLAGQAAIAIDHARLYEELRQQTDELEDKNQALTELDRLRDQFLANTSHELRTPLNGIIGIAESLVEGVTGQLPPATLDNLGLVVSSARRLSNLVNDLLDFSTLQHGKPTLARRPVDLTAMVAAVLRMSQWLVGEKDLLLESEVADDLPAVYADEDRLEQILTNLVGNAVKFTESGSVRVRAELDGGMVRVDVIDSGIGIREEVQDRIFESFEQADGSTSRLFGGTGLGLAVARELVILHGGEIGVESQPGKGSTFWFTLVPTDEQPVVSPSSAASLTALRQVPARPELAQARPAPAAPAPTSSDASPVLNADTGEAPRVLVVDDDATNLQVLVNQLSVRGFDVESALSGIQALNMIEAGYVPDVILLDVMMPTITGYDVTRKLRERFSPSELPIVLLTAKTLVKDLIEGLEAGANDYLTKPFSSGELLARLRTHLNLSSINKAVSRFVPADFLRVLERESIVDVRLGDSVERSMSVLFSDIRAFTSMSERMSPRENFRFINEYLGYMEPVVVDHHGFIDKYIGDAVMALFDRGADDAVQAGVGMLHAVDEYNQARRARGERPIRIGVGINSGKLMLGTVGGRGRMDGTVISDAVNLGSRLESLTKSYGVGMLITEYTHSELSDPEAYRLRLVDRLTVRGRREPCTIYEIFDADPPEELVAKLETRSAFETAVNCYHSGDYLGAHQGFLSVLGRNLTDLAAENYVERCRRRMRTHQDPSLS